ncbi:MAG: MarR family transcriptional regulator [Romboutsia sp.]|nr:MarR family transcriptional regulator [Romboutsia sp.]
MEKMQNIKLFSRTIIRRATKEYEMPAQHLEVLSQLISHKEGMTPMSLSKIMGVNKTIISRVIDNLNKGGYLTKTKDTKDKRSYIVSITDSGIEQVQKIYEYYLSPIYELHRILGDDDFLNLMNYIEKANIKMNEERKEILE